MNSPRRNKTGQLITVVLKAPVPAVVCWDVAYGGRALCKFLAHQLAGLQSDDYREVLLHLSGEVAWLCFSERLSTVGAIAMTERKYGCRLNGQFGLTLTDVSGLPELKQIEGELIISNYMQEAS